MHDATGSVFVAIPSLPILPLHAGDLVEVTGVTGAGDYAPTVRSGAARLLGRAQLSVTPYKATLTQLLGGMYDAQWVEIEVLVRSVHVGANNVVLEIASDGGSLSAVTMRQDGVNYQSLVDSIVRIRGNAAPVFNQRHQMVGVHVFFPTFSQVSVVVPAPRDPFAVPSVPVTQLFRYTPNPVLSHRAHVRGQVTLNWPGRMLCIEDSKGGICSQTTQAGFAEVGSFVDVIGFPAISFFKPTLEDATFRPAPGPASPLRPVQITAKRAIQEDLDGMLVQVDAELIGQDLAATEPTLMLRSGHLLFPVILPKNALGTGLPWKEGSLVRVTGVCNVQFDSLGVTLGEGAVQPQSVQILLRSLDDVVVLHAPSWWTSEHAWEGLGVVGLAASIAFVWVVVLRQRVEKQTRALRRSEERMRHLSEHDPLTNLPNRVLLNDRLELALTHAQQQQRPLGLLMVDLDRFKEVNDEFGHAAGDRLLCEIATILTGSVRMTDTVARYGGDEFIVLLPDLRSADEAGFIAEKIVGAFAAPVDIGVARIPVTVSVGVCTYPEAGKEIETLLQTVDAAMYSVKAEGRNGFRVFTNAKSKAGQEKRPRDPMSAA